MLLFSSVYFLANKRCNILPTVYGLPDHCASSVGTTTVPFIRKSPATVVALAGEAVTWSDDITTMTGAWPSPVQPCQEKFILTRGHSPVLRQREGYQAAA